MGSWDEHRLTCCHGVREGLDSHDCPKCRALTDKEYYPGHPTMLYLKDPEKASKRRVPIKKLLKDDKTKKELIDGVVNFCREIK
jgi:hypothetical protein